jgi:iron complex transport system substrate-binding protein
MMKPLAVGLCILAVVLAAVSPGGLDAATKMRIISLAPSSTEILFALGLDDEIVGVSQFCNYPEESRAKEKIGAFSPPAIEKILSLKPDIVFCTGLEQAPAVARLRQIGLKVCVSDPSTIEGLFASIREIGELTCRRERAAALVEEMRIELDAIHAKTAAAAIDKRPKVFIEIWHSPLMTAGRGSLIDELITAAGGVNIAYDTKTPYGSFSAEEVIERNPDCIILAYMQGGDSSRAVGSRLGWNGISAVRKGRVYNDINPDILLRPGPRIVEGVRQLQKRFYP